MNIIRHRSGAGEAESDARRVGVLSTVLLAYLLLFALIAWAPASWLRIVAGVVLSCFAMGSALLVLLWPRNVALDQAEWLALAGCLSLALGGVGAYLMARSPWGLQLKPWLAVAWLFCTGCFIGARCRLRDANQQAGPSIAGRLQQLATWWTDQSLASRAVTILLAVVLISGAAQLHVAIARTHCDPSMTEFYLLDDAARAQDYPHAAAAGDVVTVAYGIANRTQEEANYQVVARLGKALLLKGARVRLEPGQEYQAKLNIALPEDARGLIRVDFALEQQGIEQRRLWLWLDVPSQEPQPEEGWAASTGTGQPASEEK